jgi:SAM-dependent methyltransferase
VPPTARFRLKTIDREMRAPAYFTRQNEVNSVHLDARKAAHYGCAMAERRDTSRVAEPLNPGPGYRLAAKGRQEAEDDRLDLLERIFDPLSRRRRELAQPGWRCLEVGAGRGSMAVWLAERVGESGRVVATDIDVTYLKRFNLPNLEVRQHNILDNPLDALGPGSFDLVCSRLMLFWLAGKQETAIRRMVECLRPGGWLVDEDGDWGTVAPTDPAHPLYTRYHNAWQGGEWWASRGYDPAFGRKLPSLFERCGLQNIHHGASAEVVPGGSPWARWWKQTLEGIRAFEQADDKLTGTRDQEYQALMAPLSDPSVWLLSELLHGCRGQRT